MLNHRNQKVGVALLILVTLGLSGCVALLVGAGAAGGYAIGKDYVKNNFDLPQSYVFRKSLEVAKKMGDVTLEDPKHGQIQATVQGAAVTITVKPLTKKAVELKVKARKNLFPAMDVAQDLYNGILKRL